MMEKVLQKLAEQLDSLDEASLTALWTKYAQECAVFAPSRRWETATLILCLIQAKRMKNQLFNHYWGMAAKARSKAASDEEQRGPCPVLSFRDLKRDD